MTATKNVYALMLALVIVLSGCFGTTGTDSTDATSANQITWNGDIPNIAHSGTLTLNTGNQSGFNILLVSVETSPGEMLTIIEASMESDSGSIVLGSTCGDGITTLTAVSAGAHLSTRVAPYSALDCTHELLAYNSASDSADEGEAHWSFVYNISPVTVAATS